MKKILKLSLFLLLSPSMLPTFPLRKQVLRFRSAPPCLTWAISQERSGGTRST